MFFKVRHGAKGLFGLVGMLGGNLLQVLVVLRVLFNSARCQERVEGLAVLYSSALPSLAEVLCCCTLVLAAVARL